MKSLNLQKQLTTINQPPKTRGTTLEVKPDEKKEMASTMKDLRIRVSNYGKWYLPPDTFNRNFDLLKNKASPDQIEKQVIERIQQVKAQIKRDQAAIANNHPLSEGGLTNGGPFSNTSKNTRITREGF